MAQTFLRPARKMKMCQSIYSQIDIQGCIDLDQQVRMISGLT